MTDSNDTKSARQTRKGSCLCGAFAYELEAPEIKAVGECNCSLCSKKGYLFVFVGTDDKFTFIKGSEDALTSYTFASRNLFHKFCPTCGTGILVNMPQGPPGKQIAVNVHAIEDIDSWSLERRPFDGSALGAPYELPVHKGALPETKDDEQVYTGSCHCGALTLAVASKPLDKTYTGKTTECNCSSCERNANVWIYPLREQVVLAGADADRGEYAYGRKLGTKTFCQVCGVSMTNKIRQMSEDEVAGEPDNYKTFFLLAYKMHPVNARVLHGVDLSELTISKSQGRKL